jgi:hypothetical protein
MCGTDGSKGRFSRQRRRAGQGTTRGRMRAGGNSCCVQCRAVQRTAMEPDAITSEDRASKGWGEAYGRDTWESDFPAWHSSRYRSDTPSTDGGDDGCAKLGGMPTNCQWPIGHTGGMGNRIGMIIFRLKRRSIAIDCVPAQSSMHSHRNSAPAQGKYYLSSLFSSLLSGLFSGFLLDVQRAE